MESLVRTKVDCFELQDSLKLGQIEELVSQGRGEECVLPVEEMFASCPKVEARKNFDRMLENGNPIPWKGNLPGQKVRMYHSSGVFIGIYEWREDKRMYMPQAIFCGPWDFQAAGKEEL